MAVTPEPQQETIASIAAQLDRAAQRFEAAWRRGQKPRLEDYLPAGAEERHSVLLELIHLDLEYRLKAGENVRIESYLQRYPELAGEPAHLLDLVAREYELARRRDPRITPDDYVRRFPQLRQAILKRLGVLVERTVTHLDTHVITPASVDIAPTAALGTTDELVAVLRDGLILKSSQLDKVARDLQHRHPTPASLADELVRWTWLTAYQAEQILQGKGRDLVVGPYLVLEPLGQGGMGHVYKARHHVMRRTVALKVIRADRALDPNNVRRFQREAEAVAQLSHPNIVVAYDAGVVNNVHFFAMEFVEGTDLSKLLREQGRFSAAQACDYARQAALGLQHAHERGLVHRDIKPSNLLLTGTEGTIKLLDMGLARLLYDSGDERSRAMTRVGTLMGTPDYLSPEQALDSHSADIRSDIYSLGCTLHHLIAGQAPFPGGDLEQKLTAHRRTAPPVLEALCPDLPSGLGAVVRRMLAKKQDQRPQTPAEVAEALTPYCLLASTSIVSTTELQRSVSRSGQHRALAPDLGSATVMTPQPAAPVIWGLTLRQLRLLTLGAAGVVLCGLIVSLLLVLLPSTSEPPQPTTVAAKQTEPEASIYRLGLDAAVVLGDNRLRHSGDVVCVSFAREGTRVASASADGNVKVWDAATGRELLHLPNLGKAPVVAFDPSGNRLATSAGSSIKLWDAVTGKELTTFKGHTTEVTALAFHPKGGELASGSVDGKVRTWRPDTGKAPLLFTGHTKRIHSVAYDGTGDRLVSCSLDKTIKLWNARTPAEEPVTIDAHKNVNHVAFSPDGKQVASAGASGAAKRWDASTSAADDSQVLPAGMVLSYSPDGKRLALTDSGVVTIWDLAANKKVLTRKEQGTHKVLALAFSADGKRIASGGEDFRVNLWDASTGLDLLTSKAHARAVNGVAISPDGSRLASISFDKLLMWHMSTGQEVFATSLTLNERYHAPF